MFVVIWTFPRKRTGQFLWRKLNGMLFIHVMNISQVTNVYFVRQFRTLCLQLSFTFSSFLCFCVKKSSIIFSTFWCTVHSSIGSRSRWPQSNLSAENDIYSNLSLSLINLGGVACFKLGKMGNNWISLKDYIGGELFGPFLHPCVRPIAEDIPAQIFSSKNVFSSSRQRVDCSHAGVERCQYSRSSLWKFGSSPSFKVWSGSLV